MTAGIIEDSELETVAGELLPAVTLNDSLFVPNGMDKILAHIKAEVEKQPRDISTERGRKEIASLSRKVASSNRRIDEYGKDQVAVTKAKAMVIDAERKRSRDFLDKLRDDTRKPLTDWEDAEKNRVQAHEDALLSLAELSNVPFGASLEDIANRISSTDNYMLRSWEEFGARFAVGYQATSLRLKKLWAETKQAEEDRAQLLRLQEEEAKRIQAERDARIQAEAAAKAKADAEAKAEREASAAKIESDRKEKAAALEAKRIQDESEARTRKAEEAAAKAVLESEQAIERERQRVATEKRLEAEAAAKREANKKHCAAINRGAVDAIISSSGISEEASILVVTAIAKGEIPSVRIAY